MKELQDRRNSMLFLKRLENDGATVMLSKEDKQLFKNFGTAEAEVAENDLEQAIFSDNAQGMSFEETVLVQAAAEEAKDPSKKERDPTSLVEKIRNKRLKQVCASTQAV